MEEFEDIVKVVIDNFDNLFCASSCNLMEECLNTVLGKVTLEMQDILSRDFTAD